MYRLFKEVDGISSSPNEIQPSLSVMVGMLLKNGSQQGGKD
jgi:hypothetical protein